MTKYYELIDYIILAKINFAKELNQSRIHTGDRFDRSRQKILRFDMSSYVNKSMKLSYGK